MSGDLTNRSVLYEGTEPEHFAQVRGYVTDEEVANAEKIRRKKEKQMEERERKLEDG